MIVPTLISIVTPCYNEELNVHTHFSRVCKAIEPFLGFYSFEHIYTDNCSQDRTFEVLAEMAKQNQNFRVLRFSRNIGADRAVHMGLQYAKGDAVVLIQADLQDPPELIVDFIRGWEGGYDVVYGQNEKRQETLLLRTCKRIYYKIAAQLSDVPLPRNAGEFRLTSRRALDAVLQFRETDFYMRGVVAQVGFKQKPIAFVRQERAAGKSSNNYFVLIGYAINNLLSTTVVPIRLVTILGFIISVIGFFLTGALIVSKYIYDTAPHGFTTLAVLITFFSGALMFALGIIGEYIRKIYVQTLQRPRGFIQDKIGF